MINIRESDIWKKPYAEGDNWTRYFKLEIIKYPLASPSIYITELYEYKYEDGSIHVSESTSFSIDSLKKIEVLQYFLNKIEKELCSK